VHSTISGNASLAQELVGLDGRLRQDALTDGAGRQRVSVGRGDQQIARPAEAEKLARLGA
jgi:hypothetical protein